MIGGPETFPKGLNPFSEEFRQKLNEMAELCSAIKTLASNTPGSHAGTGGITIPEAETEEQERTLIQITAVDANGRHNWKKVQLDSNGDPEDFTGQPTGTAPSSGYAIELSGRSAAVDDVVEAWPWTLSDGSQVMLFMLGGADGVAFPAVITGNVSAASSTVGLGSGPVVTVHYRWKYAWHEAVIGPPSLHAMTAKSGGRSGTVSSGYAINLAETQHTARYSWGIDVATTNYPLSYRPKPIGGAGIGTGSSQSDHKYNVGVMMHEGVDTSGDPVYFFTEMGSHDGEC